VKALVRAFRWRKLLDTGEHAALEDLARAKGVNAIHVSLILRPTPARPVDRETILCLCQAQLAAALSAGRTGKCPVIVAN
jgi:hypothetical protein